MCASEQTQFTPRSYAGCPGIWGLLLGAPLLAIAKVICDRVDSLKPAGELLGH